MNIAAEIRRVEGLMMRFPLSPRLHKMLEGLRAKQARAERHTFLKVENEKEALRGAIQRELKGADVPTLKAILGLVRLKRVLQCVNPLQAGDGEVQP